MKTLAVILIASSVLAQFGVSLAVASQNSAAGDLAAQNRSRLEALGLPG